MSLGHLGSDQHGLMQLACVEPTASPKMAQQFAEWHATFKQASLGVLGHLTY
jgi:hypothetical protein